MPSSAFTTFAAINDDVAGDRAKLTKARLLGAYFATLEADDLPLAVRFAGAVALNPTAGQVLGVSGAAFRDAALATLPGLTLAELRTQAVKRGELGEALASLWHLHAEEDDAPLLTLADVASAFSTIAGVSRPAEKREVLAALLQRCRTDREAAYVAKIALGDLRTGVREGVLLDAIASAFDRSADDVRHAAFLLGDLGAVALLAKRDALASASFRLFHPVQFMLASPAETAEIAAQRIAESQWLAERKFDGIRVQLHKHGSRIELYTRTMDRTDAAFPEVVAAAAGLPDDLLIDGEIVPMRDDRVLPFAAIQKRLGRVNPPASIMRRHPCVMVAFDLLYHGGELLIDKPLTERREALSTLLAEQSDILLSQAEPIRTGEQVQAAFNDAREAGTEGLVLKDPASTYSPGRRGLGWLKLKSHLPTLDCVVTAAEFGHGKRRGTLSDYTFAVWTDADGELINVGKAYSGVTDAEIAQLTEYFIERVLVDHGRVKQVQPSLVLEIAFDSIQRSKRHASGFALRFPRVKRLRWDRAPSSADTLDRVKALYDSPLNASRDLEERGDEQLDLFQ